jgi:hypothetical protein
MQSCEFGFSSISSMALVYDTLFSHEYQERLLEKSPLRRWIHKIRSTGFGTIWLLLLICGFSSRKAVHRALTHGSQMAREGSRSALQQMGKAVRRTLAPEALKDAQRSKAMEKNSNDSWCFQTLSFQCLFLFTFLSHRNCLVDGSNMFQTFFWQPYLGGGSPMIHICFRCLVT